MRYSAVTDITRESVFESSARMPGDIHPLLLGSGELGIAIDATGLQGLNCWMNQLPDTQSIMHVDDATNWNLYIHRDEALSQHHCQQDQGGYKNMPCGWLDYVLTIDGVEYGPRGLLHQACNWSRRFTPRKGLAEIAYDIGGVRVGLWCGMRLHGVQLDLHVTCESVDLRPHEINLTVRCWQTLRDGRMLTTAGVTTACDDSLVFRRWNGCTGNSCAPLYQPIEVNWAIAAHGTADYAHTPEHISSTCSGNGSRLDAAFCILSGSDRDGTAERGIIESRVREFRRKPPCDVLNDATRSWQAYFDEGAEVWIGEPDKEYLVLMAQYVLRAGGSYHAGALLGTIWTQTFMGGTFPDVQNAVDGLLRTGHTGPVRDFITWLARTCRPAGRPNYHVTYYDGTPAGTDEEAIFGVFHYAALVTRLFEYHKDPDDLRDVVLPFLEKNCRWMLDDKLQKTGDVWQMKGTMAGDAHLPPEDIRDNTEIFFCITAVLWHYSRYSAMLNVDNATAREARSFVKDVTARGPLRYDASMCHRFFNWIPYLLNRVDVIDHDSLRPFFEGRYPEGGRVVVDYQPWGNFATGASSVIVGCVDEALAELQDGMLYVSGAGYFDESPYEMRGGGFAPYPSGTGSFLSFITSMFADGRNASVDIQVGLGLAKRWRHNRLRWKGIHTINGAVVSGVYSPYSMDVTVESTRPREAEILVPARVEGEPIVVRVNDRRIEPVDLSVSPRSVRVQLDEGLSHISIERDLTTRYEALVIEPMAHGREIVELLRERGMRVRWLRDLPTLCEVIDHGPKLIYLHTSYNSMPVEVSRMVGEAVQRGARLVTLFHSGRRDLDTALAALTGVNAVQPSNFWNYDSTPHTYVLTDAGSAALPGLTPTFDVPQSAEFHPAPLADVEVLAFDRASDTAVVTRRRVGQGWACWIAAGNKSADGPQYDYCRSTNEIYHHGFDYERRQKRLWLADPNWRSLFQAVAAAPW